MSFSHLSLSFARAGMRTSRPMGALMTTGDDFRARVREFLKVTKLSKATLGRLAADEDGRPMATNTIRGVVEDEPYNEETERRLRAAMDAYVVEVAALAGDTTDDDVIDETVERIAKRRRR